MLQRYRFLIITIVPLVFLSACGTLSTRDTIRLKSRDIVIVQDEISKDFLKQLKITPLAHQHAFVQLRHKPSITTKKQLKEKGVTLLFHLEPRFWVAAVSKDFSPVDKVIRSHIRWLAEIKPTDKISPAIRAGKLRDWAVLKDGQIKLAITFFEDVPSKEAKEILQKYTKQKQLQPVGNVWYVTMPKEAIETLAAHDQVKWIEQGPIPFQPFIREIRHWTYANETHGLDLSQGSLPPFYHGPTGAGVQVGFWDTGIDAEHEDFIDHWDENGNPIIRSRILNNPNSTDTDSSDHGTRVAGVLGASGYRSDQCLYYGSYPPPYSFRGIAPEVQFIDYMGSMPLFLSNSDEATNTYGMDLSNHAYLLSTNGIYDSNAKNADSYLRYGWQEYETSPVIPPRPMVWAAGNNGILSQYSDVRGYFSVEAPAKNVITVGAGNSPPVSGGSTFEPRTVGLWYSGNWATSLGPTWDGRIKPEIIASASDIRTTVKDWDCYGNAGSGTSLATGVVSGTLALMLEQYAITYNVDLDQNPPLPSTLKAILIQTATDLVGSTAASSINPDTGTPVNYHAGPDYATGFGLVNAQAAVELIKRKHIIEDSITSTGEVDEYPLWVAANRDRLQFTIAWDDEPYLGDYADQTTPRLVNDLDLTLIAPDGTEHYPWKLDPLTPADDPANDDPISAADITPANRDPGHDHLNNVEQVTVDGPIQPGRWIVQVAHYSTAGLFETPQPYSLVGDFFVIVTQVSAGYLHTCGLMSNNSVACWGGNYAGQSNPPSGAFTQVSAGHFHTCGLKDDDSVACWGDNDASQSNPPSGAFTQVSAGYLHTCGLRSNGSVACWGLNSHGQSTPPNGAFTQVSAGVYHTCGLKSNGSVVCWGWNVHGQSNPPNGAFTQVSAGIYHSCGLRSNGSAACWGLNSLGQSTPPSETFTQISVGSLHHACGLKSDGSVVCWGSNLDGKSTPPREDFTQVNAGGDHTCGLKSDGSVACWGNNYYGQSNPPTP